VIPPHVQTASPRSSKRLRLAFAALALCMASACAQSPGLVASPPASTSAAETAAAAAFAGRWAYAQSCGWQHSAELEFKTTAEGVRGTWSDGTRVRGEAGELSGEYRDGKMFLRFCRDDVAESDPEACPDFRAEDAYVVREAGNLIWYRASGADSYRRYLELSPVIVGQDIPKDDRCPEED
jgi:hypothetical protein